MAKNIIANKTATGILDTASEVANAAYRGMSNFTPSYALAA